MRALRRLLPAHAGIDPARPGDPDWDLRRIEPYCGYETYDFNVVTPPFDDRLGLEDDPPERSSATPGTASWWPVLEVVESIRLCEQALDRYPSAQGSHRVELPRHLPAGEAYVETECPRGQMGFYVVGERPA